ncbi:ABC transporter permease [Salipiger aestuarii]|uniref:ABC-type nitrate/sulfonate/bicarbonate transport system permease component n=1 Tax=Salipiger aestuarii TaxID=568098 RepID=A0A327YS42_9RHOB|nr:ABC transporter permease subunit [Salipiger aestuarii]RAK23994.1 ABC-type nitrate/sulfonate/bicarbonate transport system permease component [Salipiger aestuarii]
MIRMPRVVVWAALLLGWEVFARLTADGFVIAAPTEIAQYVWRNTGLLWRATGVTGWVALQGFVWGNLAGVMLALAAVLIPRAERGLLTLALLAFCLPLVATGPILRVLYGPGQGPQVTLAALSVVYTTFLSVLVGLRAVPQSWLDLARSYGRGPVTLLALVRLPAALPYLVAGLQIAAPAAFLGAMVGEFTGAERGLGVLTVRALRGLDLPATWAVALLAAALSMAAFAGIGALGRRLSLAPPEILLAAPDDARGRAGASIQGIAAVAVALAVWQGAMDAFDLPRFFARRPGDVWDYLVTAPEAGAHRANLLAALGETLTVALPGYGAGLLLGAGLAALLTLAPPLAALVLPVSVALRSIPIIATAPLIVWALGRGAAGSITVVAVMIFFPTLVACLHGLARAPRPLMDLFDSYDAGPLRRLWGVQLPAMLPAFFASARMAVPAAILAVTTAEWLATGRGIGALMATVASTSDYAMLWSAIAVIGLAALATHAGVAALERAVLRRTSPEQLAG